MTLRLILINHVLPALLADPRLLPVDIHVYLHLFLHPIMGARRHLEIIRVSESTFHRSIGRLLQTDWAYVASKHDRYGGRLVVPWMPLRIERAVAQILESTQFNARFRGEWLLQCMLDHVVDDRNAVDNARPPWLVSGEGSARLELDRWYPDLSVAMEFQGEQHFRKGDTLSTTDAELHEQIDRDNLKAAICMRNRIKLFEFKTDDLRYSTVLSRLADSVPLVPVRESGPIYTTMGNMCVSYRNFMARR